MGSTHRPQEQDYGNFATRRACPLHLGDACVAVFDTVTEEVKGSKSEGGKVGLSVWVPETNDVCFKCAMPGLFQVD